MSITSINEGMDYSVDGTPMKVGGTNGGTNGGTKKKQEIMSQSINSVNSQLKPLSLIEKINFLKKKKLPDEQIALVMFSTMIYVDPEDDKNTKYYIYKKAPYRRGSDIFNLHTFRNICSPYRLIQFTGTCYLNACINSLFMPLETRLLMEDIYKHIRPELKKTKLYELSYEDIAAGNGTISQLFLSLVYNKIIKNNHIDNDIDLMDKLGALVKKDYCDRYKNNPSWMKHCKNIDVDSGTSGNPKFSIATILKHIYEDMEKSYLKRLEKIIYLHYSESLIVPVTNTFNNISMKLVSGNISFTGENVDGESFGHAVACYICENKSFIYDSNNYICQDSWEKGRVHNYSTYFKYSLDRMNEGKKKKITSVVSQFNYLFYLSEDYIKKLLKRKEQEKMKVVEVKGFPSFEIQNE
jgi:hypothetical protein